MRRLLLIGALALPLRAAQAEESDPTAKLLPNQDPIDIKSDRLEAHNKERKVVFEGNVQARQRDVLIFADRLTTFYDKAGKEVERIVADGNVKITQADKVGTAEQAVFENRSRKISLFGQPHLWQGKDELRGEAIYVYIDEDRVQVEKARGVFSPKRAEQEGAVKK